MLICYYRSEDEIRSLLREAGSKVTDRAGIMDFIKEKYGMVELGLLVSVLKDSIWVGHGGIEKHSKFKVSPGVLDGLVNKMAYGDVVRQRNLVAVFGKLENGRVVEAVALNKNHLVDPSTPA
jgi:hypothetical protein